MVEGQFDPNMIFEARHWQFSDFAFCSQTSRSGYVMYPYLISVYGLGAG